MCIYLIIGVILFGLVHLYPATLMSSRQSVIDKIGEGPYKGIYSLIVLLSLVLIVIGWQITPAVDIYAPPEWGHLAAQVLMYPALFLFISARAGSNIKRAIRHPQLTSIVVWGVAHLLANGESRSILLFGAFAAWALIQMHFLNRRDGEWQKPEPVARSRDIIVGIIALVVYVGLVYGHGYFTGTLLIHS